MKDGTIKSAGEQDWEYVVPDTNLSGVLDFVCTYKKGVLNIPKREDN